MKNINLTIFLLGLAVFVVRANENENASLFRQGSVWSYFNYSGFEYEYTFFRYKIDGDTIINDKSYKKVYQFTSCTYDAKDAWYVGAFREDSGAVYCPVSIEREWLPTRNGEAVLYDFSLNVGDKVMHTIGSYTSEVEKVDSVMIDNKKRKRITFSDGEDVWIEGLGCTKNSFFEPFSPKPTCVCGNELNLFNNSSGETVYTKYSKSEVGMPLAFKDEDCAYHSLEGLNWVERYGCPSDADPNHEDITICNYKVEGDTLLSGIHYKKVYIQNMNTDYKEAKAVFLLSEDSVWTFYRSIREDPDHRIYLYGSNQSAERLLYDFSEWEVGDTLFSGFERHDTIAVITENNLNSMQLLDGTYRKTVSNAARYAGPLVHGIGYIQNGYFWSPFQSTMSCKSYGIIKFCMRDKALYQNPEYVDVQDVQIPKNEVKTYSENGILNFEFPFFANQLNLYATNGTLLRSYLTEGKTTLRTTLFPQGVYIYKITDRNGSTIARGKVVVS